MDPGDDISPAAKAWGGVLTFAEVLILVALTIGAFAYNIFFGVAWLLLGVPILGVVFYAVNLVLVAPVALIAGGATTKRKKIHDEALLSAPCTLASKVLADVDQFGALELHDDGFVFRNSRKKKAQVFKWTDIDSYGVGDEKGLFINAFDGRWALILQRVEGDVRDQWRAALVEHEVVEHSTARIGEHPVML